MASTGDTWRLGHRPALDGVRGVAILLVLIEHTGVLPSPVGVVGVAMFFTLSGFLITRLILERKDAGTWSYRGFMAARAVRLFPAFVVMVATISALLLGIGAAPGEVGIVAAHALTYTQNVFPDLSVLHSPYRHAWSLAVEEQFYLVWPLVLCVMPRPRASWMISAIAGSVALRIALTAADAPGGSWLPTQAAGLLMGCLLAFYAPRLRTVRGLALASWAGLGGLSVSVSALPMPYVVGAFGGSLLTVGLVASALTSHDPILNLGVTRWAGRISYSLYLWHYPLLVIATATSWRTFALPALGIALLAATISTIYIEEPTREAWRRRQGQTSAACAATRVPLRAVP